MPAECGLSGVSVSKRVRGKELDDNPDRWARVKHVFQSALDRPVTERLTFVRDRCGADDDLHAEVVSLLVAHVNADGFAEVPAIQKLNPATSLASTDHSLKRGDRLGPYQIVEWLDAGGMGEVYRARDPQVGRDVAIKILLAQFSTDPDRLRRFEQEVRSAGSLNHPNLLTIYYADVHAGCPYLVSELLEGETLRKRFNRGPVPARKSAEYAAEIASGLAATHDRNITHRDLKPENIFITTDDRIKILDFGLAKLRETNSDVDATGNIRTTAGVGARHGGLHVSGAGAGTAGRPSLRHLRARCGAVRVGDRPACVSRDVLRRNDGRRSQRRAARHRDGAAGLPGGAGAHHPAMPGKRSSQSVSVRARSSLCARHAERRVRVGRADLRTREPYAPLGHGVAGDGRSRRGDCGGGIRAEPPHERSKRRGDTADIHSAARETVCLGSGACALARRSHDRVHGAQRGRSGRDLGAGARFGHRACVTRHGRKLRGKILVARQSVARILH